MPKFLENLQEADKILRVVDHMVYVTFPLIKDKRILLKVLLEIKKSIAYCINSILQYEYVLQRISLSKNAKENFNTFERRCAKRYGISEEEIKLIVELFEILEKHNNSPFEFMKEEKIVILSETLVPKVITLEEIKKYLFLAKSICKKAKMTILLKDKI